MPLLLKVLCPFEISLNVVHELAEFNDKQESIPVGCVSSAVVTVVGGVPSRGGVYLPRGCSYQEVYLPGGLSTWGVPAGGVPAQGSTSMYLGGGCTCLEVCLPSACWDIPPPPPPLNRILDTCLCKHYLSATSFVDGKNIKMT